MPMPSAVLIQLQPIPPAERALAAVRACPGITAERIAAVAMVKGFDDVIPVLEQLIEAGMVEKVNLHGGEAWFPIPFCMGCGCTDVHACEEGCGWAIRPGETNGGEYAGICSRCRS